MKKMYCILVLCSILIASQVAATTPTWDGWDFDIGKVAEEKGSIIVSVKYSGWATMTVGKVRVNCIVDGREVESHYLEVPREGTAVARFALENIMGKHPLVFQIWGGPAYGWKFDESSSKQYDLGKVITPPLQALEITTRESGPYTIYSCKFSEGAVNRMADDRSTAETYARQIVWRIASEKFGMSQDVFETDLTSEVNLALAAAISQTADKLHGQSRVNRGKILVYEVNCDNRAVPLVEGYQVARKQTPDAKILREIGRLAKFIWSSHRSR